MRPQRAHAWHAHGRTAATVCGLPQWPDTWRAPDTANAHCAAHAQVRATSIMQCKASEMLPKADECRNFAFKQVCAQAKLL